MNTSLIEKLHAVILGDSFIEKATFCDEIRRKVELGSKSLLGELEESAPSMLVHFFRGWLDKQISIGEIDLALINAVLTLRDGSVFSKVIDAESMSSLEEVALGALSAIERGEMKVACNSSERNRVDELELPASGKKELVLIVPGMNSVVAAYTAEKLLSEGVSLSAVIVSSASPFGLRRGALSGSRIKAVKRKLFFGYRKLLRYFYKPERYIDIRSVVKETGIGRGGLKAFCDKNNVPLRFFPSINDSDAVDYVRALRPDYGVYLASEIVRKPFLEGFSCGVIHSHPGVIPDYKGMDSIDWALLQKDFSKIGYSIQVLTPSLDDGKIVKIKTMDDVEGLDVQTIRSRVLYFSIEDTVSCTVAAVKNGVRVFSLDGSKGKQYFFMKPQLRRLISTAERIWS